MQSIELHAIQYIQSHLPNFQISNTDTWQDIATRLEAIADIPEDIKYLTYIISKRDPKIDHLECSNDLLKIIYNKYILRKNTFEIQIKLTADGLQFSNIVIDDIKYFFRIIGIKNYKVADSKIIVSHKDVPQVLLWAGVEAGDLQAAVEKFYTNEQLSWEQLSSAEIFKTLIVDTNSCPIELKRRDSIHPFGTGAVSIIDITGSSLPQYTAATQRVVFVLDISGSMQESLEKRILRSRRVASNEKLQSKLEMAREIIKNTLTALPDNTKIALVAFNHQVQIVCELSTKSSIQEHFLAQLNSIQASGSTDIKGGVLKALEVLKHDSEFGTYGFAKKECMYATTVVLITDGQDNSMHRTLANVPAQSVKLSNDIITNMQQNCRYNLLPRVVPIGVGEGYNEHLLFALGTSLKLQQAGFMHIGLAKDFAKNIGNIQQRVGAKRQQLSFIFFYTDGRYSRFNVGALQDGEVKHMPLDSSKIMAIRVLVDDKLYDCPSRPDVFGYDDAIAHEYWRLKAEVVSVCPAGQDCTPGQLLAMLPPGCRNSAEQELAKKLQQAQQKSIFWEPLATRRSYNRQEDLTRTSISSQVLTMTPSPAAPPLPPSPSPVSMSSSSSRSSSVARQLFS
jgi:hypothetical protein